MMESKVLSSYLLRKLDMAFTMKNVKESTQNLWTLLANNHLCWWSFMFALLMTFHSKYLPPMQLRYLLYLLIEPPFSELPTAFQRNNVCCTSYENSLFSFSNRN